MLNFFYHTAVGRLLLRPLTAPCVSRAVGHFLDSRASIPLIAPFVRRNGIDLTDYEPEDYASFNAFFSRHIRAGLRPIDSDPTALIAPCDGLLSVYPIQKDLVLPVKQSRYTIASLLRDESLASAYTDGVCLVFRLCVHHYHRYGYADSGVKSPDVFLPGRLHTVRPVALETVPVFTENSRSYTVIRSEHFGDLLQMEVGALLVGKIQNHHPEATFVVRGEEKGTFLYGGSTILLLLPKDKVQLDPLYGEATARGEETPVRLGQRLGQALS
jgi:phosphatidylserine decarboxylase